MRIVIAALLLLSVGCYSESPETRLHNLTEMINDIEGEIGEIARALVKYESLVDGDTLKLIKSGKIDQLSEAGKKDSRVIKDMEDLIKELRERQDKLKRRRNAIAF